LLNFLIFSEGEKSEFHHNQIALIGSRLHRFVHLIQRDSNYRVPGGSTPVSQPAAPGAEPLPVMVINMKW
jgi:hypothetical protein